ncbi:conserved hypothetical protein [Chloroherpeton thalassium ATCC 35110]|uniref:Transferase hexapeptide repeat containing protein n=1 Tax=Chloroherpeton thalassium (strain ATCC 35110 / GB-78) TaxID=517418 RepID=B3QU80_CHLT3|nr:GlmU family protein [Chloroherpeton thalassium]ACF14329.1 conserved hypothetical protein [Chloroherpeton thalassium ATCC 35110]
MQIIIFEDDSVQHFLPLVYLKPVYDLRVGFGSLKEKFTAKLSPKAELFYHLRTYLRAVFEEVGVALASDVKEQDDVLFLSGRVICDDGFSEKVLSGFFQKNTAYYNGGQIVAFRGALADFFPDSKNLPNTISVSPAIASLPAQQVDCDMLSFLWDLIRLHPQEFLREAKSCSDFGQIKGKVSPHAFLVNEKNIFIGEGAEVKAGAVLDAEDGYIYVSPGAKILPNAVLMENVFLGQKSTIKIGAKIYSNVFIGEQSKVGGEVEDSIIEPFANKQHEGFIGHSYISSWCNLGADTNNSDLKNNYSSVRMTLAGKSFDTKMQFLGLFMGEHSKSGINTMFNTGTVVGLSSNIFGAGFPPKYVGSFQWGGKEDGLTEYRLVKALEVARAMMKRRKIDLTPAYETAFRAAYALEKSRK